MEEWSKVLVEVDDILGVVMSDRVGGGWLGCKIWG